MDNLINLADQLEAWAKRNDVATRAAKAFREIGQLDQARAENERRLADTNAALTAKTAELKAAQDEVHKASVTAEDIKAAARTKGDALVSEAVVEAQAIKDAAHNYAASIKREADHAAQDARTSADRMMREASAAVRKAQDELDALRVETDAAKSEFAQIQAQLTAAKNEVKRMLGGG